MIIVRSPLRITLGGGGTDLPVYYKKFGGQLITATINKYVYITLHNSFYNEHLLKYSVFEKVSNIREIKHPILRTIFDIYNPDRSLELSSMADIPAGTGMGSSGAFTCATLLAFNAMDKKVISKTELAEEACHIEIDILGEPIGKQDQYASAFGGMNEFKFNADETINVTPLGISKETYLNLQSNLLIFSTGFSRSASQILKNEQSNVDITTMLHRIKEIGIKSKDALLNGDLDEFGRLLDVHWRIKHSTTDKMSNDRIDKLYNLAIDNGALGGKLIGAGGGGFLMFYTNYPRQLRKIMNGEGLIELDYSFESYGSQVIML